MAGEARMIDVLALARRYVPTARPGFSSDAAAIFIDMSAVCRVLVVRNPEHGWAVELLSPPCTLFLDSAEDARTVAQVMVNQIELSKSAHWEQLEDVQTRVLESAHNEEK